jgi:predicted negative regulator of RcsB-dependent stress response
MRIKVLAALAPLFVILLLPPAEAARRRKSKSPIRPKAVSKSVKDVAVTAGYAALAKGDIDSTIKAWRPVFKSAPGELTTYALWLQFAQLCLENNRLTDLESAAREADASNATPELRASARLVLWRAAQREKRPAEAQKIEKSLDFVRDWQVVGPFYSEASGEASGFDTVFAPERENLLNKTINNQRDRPVRWRSLPVANDGNCLVGRFLGDESEEPAVFYAATALNAPYARTVQLRINHSGTLKLWLNGKLIFLDNKSRSGQNLAPDGFVITQKLEAGWNSLLLKIAEDEAQEAFFSLRLTNANGDDLFLPPANSKHFAWQILSGKMPPAAPHLLQAFESFATPDNAETTKTITFAKRFWVESASTTSSVSGMWPPQMELLQKAARLAQENKTKEAIVAYQELLQSEEFLPGAWQRLARLQKQANDQEGALLSLRKLRTLRPQDASIAAQYADLLNERGDRNGALSVYQQALTLDSSQIFLREKVRRAKGEKSLLDSIPAASVPPPAKELSPQAETTVLLDEARQIVYDDGATLTHFHQVIQINSQAAAQRYATLPLELPTPTARLTIESLQVTSGGRTAQVATDEMQISFKFPALKIGDVLDISYRVEESRRGILARQFWTRWFFNLSDARVQQSRFVLITPSQMTFNFRSHGEIGAPQRSEVKTGSALWHVREWRLENLAPRRIGALPVAQDTALWIDISSIPDWELVIAWYRDRTAAYCAPDAAIRSKALQLTKNARTPLDKLRALHAYVARGLATHKEAHVNWFKLTIGQKIMRDGYGDTPGKAALLVALCKAIGIEANLALFNARSEGLTPYLPAPRFKQAMVVAQIENGPLWLDVAHPSFDYLPAENQGVPGLLIENNSALTKTSITTPVLPAENNISAGKYQAQLAATGELKGELEMALSGEWADVLRANFRSLPVSQRPQGIKQFSSQLMTAVRPTGGTLHNIDDFEQPLKLQLAYAGENYAVVENATLTLPLPWQNPMNIPQGIVNETVNETANQNPDTGRWEVAGLRGLSLDTLKLQLPLGFAPVELPDEIKDTSAFGRYRFTYKVEGDANTDASSESKTLIVTREVLLTPLRVSSEEAPAHKAFCQSILRESERKIVLKK